MNTRLVTSTTKVPSTGIFPFEFPENITKARPLDLGWYNFVIWWKCVLMRTYIPILGIWISLDPNCSNPLNVGLNGSQESPFAFRQCEICHKKLGNFSNSSWHCEHTPTSLGNSHVQIIPSPNCTRACPNDTWWVPIRLYLQPQTSPGKPKDVCGTTSCACTLVLWQFVVWEI